MSGQRLSGEVAQWLRVTLVEQVILLAVCGVDLERALVGAPDSAVCLIERALGNGVLQLLLAQQGVQLFGCHQLIGTFIIQVLLAGKGIGAAGRCPGTGTKALGQALQSSRVIVRLRVVRHTGHRSGYLLLLKEQGAIHFSPYPMTNKQVCPL